MEVRLRQREVPTYLWLNFANCCSKNALQCVVHELRCFSPRPRSHECALAYACHPLGVLLGLV